MVVETLNWLRFQVLFFDLGTKIKNYNIKKYLIPKLCFFLENNSDIKYKIFKVGIYNLCCSMFHYRIILKAILIIADYSK